MTRKGTPRPNNGGARVGAGRKPTTKPLRMIKLDDDTARMLAEITVYMRKHGGSNELSQADVVAELVYVYRNGIRLNE